MPRVVFTSHLQRYFDCAEAVVSGCTLRGALQQVFESQPRARDYILDEQGELRRHVFVFVDGERIRDGLDLAVGAEAQIYVMQALTGG